MMESAVAIDANGLTKRYGGIEVISAATFSLPTGSKTALIGPNGSGKTTLLGMLSSLITPSAGEATLAGHSLTVNLPLLRRKIGVLAHLPMIYEELSPFENLQFFARLYEIDEPDSRIEKLLRIVGLWRRRAEPTQVLSRGYHQRLALARALLHRPQILLLDEPETGLDPDGIQLLDELVLRAPDITVLAATHLIERVASWSDGVLRLERGRVVEVAKPSKTDASPKIGAPA